MSLRLPALCALGFALLTGGACDNRGPVVVDTGLITDTNSAQGPYEVTAVLKDKGGVDTVRVFFGAAGDIADARSMIPMAPATESDLQPRYLGLIPGFPLGTEVRWGIEACDTRGNCTTEPETYPTVYHSFVVGKLPSDPGIDRLAPDHGPESGGTRVVIDGRDFRPGVEVLFDGVLSDNVEWIRTDRIAARAPPHEPALVPVRVRNPDGAQAELDDAFTYTPAPFVTAVTPTLGPAGGGTFVTVEGGNFDETTRVFFDGVPCRDAVRLSETVITCVTPPGAPGLVDVSSLDAEGAGATLPEAFEYIAPPRAERVEPDRGPDLGGTVIVITGDDFQAGAQVLVDGVACEDNTYGLDAEGRVSISCTVPEGAPGIVDVVVINPDGQSDVVIGGFNYLGPPVAIQVIPSLGPVAGGTEVDIIGAGLSVDMNVFFGTAQAEIVEAFSDLQLRVIVPPTDLPLAPAPASGLGPVDVTVQNTGPLDFRQATLDNGFSYVWPPEVFAVVPGSGSTEGGTPVTITGRFYFDLGVPFEVFFGEAQCTDIVVVSSTTITCTTPPGPEGFVDVTVQNAETSSGTLVDGYEYIPPPEVIDVLPGTGPTFGGETVTVVGDNFQPGAVLFFDGLVCDDVLFVDEQTLVCVTPPHPAGFVDVQVINPDGQQDTGASLYEYLPVSVDPDFGLEAGFTRVRIRAAGIDPNATWRFDNEIATQCNWVSSQEVSCQTPPHVGTGSVDVSFTNPNGTGDVGEGAFSYRTFRPTEGLNNLGLDGNEVAIEDIDADGDLDAVIANGLSSGGESDFVYLNDGAADFDREDLPSGAFVSNSVNFGNLDDDGDLDMVIGVSDQGSILLYTGNGDGSFTQVTAPSTNISSLSGAFDVQLLNLIGDAKDDLFALTIGCSNGDSGDCGAFGVGADGFWERTGPNSFADRSNLVPHDLGLVHDHKIAPTDLDGDGDLDLVLFVDNFNFGADGNRHRILINETNAGGGFVEDDTPFIGLVGDVFGVDVGDLNGDNREDVVAASCEPVFESSEVVYFNEAGTLVRNFSALPIEQNDCDVGVHIFDADNDGDNEIAFTGLRGATFHNKVYVNRGDGTFVESPRSMDEANQGGPTLGADLESGDLDGDGDNDLIVVGNGLAGGNAQTLLLLLEE